MKPGNAGLPPEGGLSSVPMESLGLRFELIAQAQAHACGMNLEASVGEVA
jgi:hypothetical protein